MKKAFRSLALALALALLMGMLPAAALAADNPLDTSERVELVMYLFGNEPPRYPAMLEEFNKMALEELNCTLSVYFIGWGEYTTKYPLLLSSNEEIDLIYAATWIDFANLAKRGAFLPLEDLLPIYCAESLKDQPPEALVQGSVDGHVYAYTSNVKTYSAYGAIVRGDLREKYNLPPVTDFDSYAAYLQAIVDNEPSFTDAAGGYNDPLFEDAWMFSKGLHPLTGSTGGVYYIDTTAEKPTVFAAHEWEGFREMAEKMKDWSDRGFWPKSILSITDDGGTMMKQGVAASRVHNFDNYVSDYIQNPNEWKIEWTNLVPKINHLSYLQDTMAVPSSSKHPDRALMLLDKIRTDARYYNMLTYGIEGVDYEFDENGFVKVANQDTFASEPGTWGFRMEKFHRQGVGAPPTYVEEKAALEAAVVPNIFRSFNMDTAPVKNEYAAMQNVYAQYYYPLSVGVSTDLDADIAKLAEQATAAGNDVVKAELQRQVDAFYAANAK
ncbi:MAG: ABC transporter substrate-binding protein [Oscillospiraceae bacterium]|jgi:putative aldouronate transport system substrate-binding protein|nr:ABC transporter substrate-binding protein [Oscillospiraceae bacterium]